MNNKYINITFTRFFLNIFYDRKYLLLIVVILVVFGVYVDLIGVTKLTKYITNTTDLFFNFLIMWACFVGSNVFSIIIDMIISFIIRDNNKKCIELIFKHLLKQESSFFFNQNEGHLVSQIGKLSENINDILKIMAKNFFRFFQIIIYVIFIGFNNILFSIGVILYIAILVFISYLFNKKISKIYAEIWKRSAQSADYLSDGIKNILARKTLNTQKIEHNTFSKFLNHEIELEKTANNWQNLNLFIFYSFGGTVIALMYYFNYLSFLNHGDITLMSYQKFYLVFILMVEALFRTQDLVNNTIPISGYVESAKMAYKNLQFDSTYERSNQPMPDNFIITLHNVSISIDNILFLKNVNMTINYNDHILLVGKSGSGKTTLCLLVMAIIQQTAGKILINDIPIMEICHGELIKKIAYCPQTCILYNNTIKYNIVIGLDNYNESNYLKSLELCLINEFINEMQEKDLTNVGSSGNKLSGGQRQRVCLARAVLRILEGAEILILDEVFTSLDKNMAIEVARNLKSIIGKKTSLCIDHIGIWEEVNEDILNKRYLLENSSIV